MTPGRTAQAHDDAPPADHVVTPLEVVRPVPEGPRTPAPARHAELVVRERLIRALAGSHPRLRVIVAPAGYGKTTLLQQWSERDTRPFAWVTAGRGHDDPVRLLTDVVLALDDLEPVDEAVLAALRTPEPAIATVVLPRLERSLGGWAVPFVLVVDELEALERQEAHDALGGLAAALPPGCVLALASRREPALPLGRLRAHGEVVELRGRDLAMTRGEGRAMLRAAGTELDAEQVDRLVERTEGWPAGLYLAALALREQEDVATAVARFAGDDRLVSDYLRDELLAHLPAAHLEFLTRVSPLETLSGPLCDAVLGTHGSGVMLRDLARSNLLLSSLDRSEEHFRCHTLLAEALQSELRRAEPELEAEVHRRASDWYDERADAECAIEHAIAAHDAARAGRLIWPVVPAYGAYGGAATIRRWLGHFRDDELARHPELALTAATVNMVRGDRDMVERWGRIAEALVDGAPAGRRDDLEAGVAIMRATVARDGIERMRIDAARAYALEPEDSPWRAQCCLLIGAADVLSGSRAEGCAQLEEGSRRGAMGAPSLQVLCLALLGLVALMDEDWDNGARLAELARAQVERVGLRDDVESALVYAVSALASAHRGRADAARGDVRSARRLLTAVRDFTPFLDAATTLALARAELRLGDVLGARTLLDECERVAGKMPDAPVLQAWLDDAWRRADAFVHDAVAGPSAVTTAELRVLHRLPSHLPLREIAAELGVSANTVKTQAHALYRKLDASSRSEAVDRATQLGLLDP